MLTHWLTVVVDFLTRLAPHDSVFSVPAVIQGLLAVILVCLICGAVGSLVVGNRMAFFSDALAHCAFAGVGIGMLAALLGGAVWNASFGRSGILLVMITFGIGIG